MVKLMILACAHLPTFVDLDLFVAVWAFNKKIWIKIVQHF